MRLHGTELHYILVYHPLIDGQSERLNQCLESFFRCMTIELPSQRSKWHSMGYNISCHSSLRLSLVESLQGYKPLPLPMGPYYGTIIPAANTELMIEY